MLELGLCCIFREQPIHFRTATASYLSRLSDRFERLAYVSERIVANVAALEEAIRYCKTVGIGCFRLTSRFFPLITHPDYRYKLEELPACAEILAGLSRCKDKMRFTLHPDQFVVLNSPRAGVVCKSLEEIEYHALLAGLVGADVLTLHAGGAYGDKEAALERLERGIAQLSGQARSLLALENDDVTYTPEELLPFCERMGLPFVYDVHHHRCLPDRLSIEEATAYAVASWRHRKPLLHLSSPWQGWQEPTPRRHHDYIDPSDFPLCWLEIDNLTVEVEAKAKELAVLQLMLWLTTQTGPTRARQA